MVIILSEEIVNMMKVNIWNGWIIKCVLTKFDLLKMDKGRETGMRSDAMHYHATYR